MSQEKVLKYKEEKANRKETMKKQKIAKIEAQAQLMQQNAAQFLMGDEEYQNIFQ